jgi:uncharacterized phiE125 gp8 family phage protein
MSTASQNASPRVLTEWSEIRTAGPAIRAISLTQAKSHLRLPLNDTYHDDQLNLHIDSAIERVEHDTDRSLVSQSFELWGYCFPQPSGYIALTREPITAVDSIKYTPEDGGAQLTVDPGDYVYDDARRMVFTVDGFEWPGTNLQSKSVIVAYSAGVASASEVPAELISGALLVVANLFYGIDNLETYESVIGRYKRSRYP